MMQVIKIGSVVYLVSGGPNMSVVRLDRGVRKATCAWFDDSDVKGGVFPLEALILVAVKQP